MENRFQIKIDSILGGESPYQNNFVENQFMQSLGVDPDAPQDQSDSNGSGIFLSISQGMKPSGLIRPTSSGTYGSSTAGLTMWMVGNPKNGSLFAYCNAGSIYTIEEPYTDGYITGLTDLTDAGTASGNGMEYYDNYIYAARDTTIARYGPLDGTPAWADDYWVSTLAKTALSATLYPTPDVLSALYRFPNHVLKRHRGVLYIADVVDNQGYLHTIQTSKTTVEGDTNNGSTYLKLDFPYGYWPTSIESYGDSLVIALFEGATGALTNLKSKAKIAFWDTVSENYNQLIEFEFPDPVISRIINVNGYLYIVSGSVNYEGGTRISRYVGGNSFEQIAYIDRSTLPPHDAVDQALNRLFVGGSYVSDDSANGVAVVKAIGSSFTPMEGIFSVLGARSTSNAGPITSVKSFPFPSNAARGYLSRLPIFAWYEGSSGGSKISYPNNSDAGFSSYSNVFRSASYTLEQRFLIDKIRIPVLHPLREVNTATGTKQITLKVYTDDGRLTYTQTIINDTNYPRRSGNDPKTIIIKPTGCIGERNFFLQFTWDTDELITLGLPIVIEGQYLEDYE